MCIQPRSCSRGAAREVLSPLATMCVMPFMRGLSEHRSLATLYSSAVRLSSGGTIQVPLTLGLRSWLNLSPCADLQCTPQLSPMCSVILFCYLPFLIQYHAVPTHLGPAVLVDLLPMRRFAVHTSIITCVFRYSPLSFALPQATLCRKSLT